MKMADRVDLKMVEAKSSRTANKQDQAVAPFFFAGAGPCVSASWSSFRVEAVVVFYD
jgi:hypothetical protein